MADNPIPQLKTCTKCGGAKTPDEFSRDRHKKSGYKSARLACDKASNLRWRESRPEYAGDYRRRKPEILRAATVKWRAANPEKVREQGRQRPPRDPVAKQAYNQAYYQKNKDLIRGRIDHAKLREYAAKRRSTPCGRIDAAISTGIRQSLAVGIKSRRKWETLVGYTVDELMAHLERLFLEGMTWENYGPIWHVDHVIPKSAFNYETPDHIDFKRCWALSNLRPLWAVDNMVKHAKLLAPFQPSLAI